MTRTEIRSQINPVTFAVKHSFFKQNGEGTVRCENMDYAMKLVAATSALSDKYDISILKPMKPRVRISGVSSELSEDEIISYLKKQNNLPDPCDAKVIRLQKNEHRQTTIRMCTEGYELMVPSLNHYNSLSLNRYNCSAYGHKASTCDKPPCCPKCAGDHKANEREADFEKCVNCDQRNRERKSPCDEIFDIDHSAWSSNCPIYQKRANNAKQRIDYSV